MQFDTAKNEEPEKPKDNPETSTITEADDSQSTLVSGRQLAFIFAAFMCAFSLVALDQTILSTALPTISSHFKAVDDLSWIASAYFLPQAGFMLFFGRLTAIAPNKVVFLICLGIFELGSLFCAVAPSVNFLIFGRAVAGLGGAGMWVSILSIIARITTMAQRPIIMGLFGGMYAIATIIGPLIGGAFSDHVTWRWCFYINLPLGGVGLIALLFILPNHSSPVKNEGKHWWDRWAQLDWVGTVLSVAMVVSLLLPLQWGGNQKAWNDPAVLGTLIAFAFLVIIFPVWEWRKGDKAILPISFLMRRNMLGAFIEAALIQMGFVLASYYLPLLYQLRGHSATRSGIDILPYMLTGVFASIINGGVVAKTGYIWPFLFFMPLISAAGFGLLFTVSETTTFARIAGYQVLVGIGVGGAIQSTIIVAQAEFRHNEALVPQATSIITFMQFIGSSVGLAAAGAVFSSQLKSSLATLASSLPADVIQEVLTSVTAVTHLAPEERIVVVKAYVQAVDKVFLVGLASAALAPIAALLIKREKINQAGIGGLAM